VVPPRSAPRGPEGPYRPPQPPPAPASRPAPRTPDTGVRGPDDDAAACRSFASSYRNGTDPGDIIDGARAWVAAADAPRFLPALVKWLDGRGWQNDPPKRRQRQRRNGGKVSLVEIALNHVRVHP
jgi:hypothetical protein